jgi:hypothetical protein
MPWKPQPNKPFAMDLRRHPFQQGNAAGIVLDQIVIGRKNGGDFSLDIECRT